MGKRQLVALLNVSSWCLVVVGWLFLAMPWGCLRCVIVVYPDHTHLLFFLQVTDDFVQGVKGTDITIISQEIFQHSPYSRVANLKVSTAS